MGMEKRWTEIIWKWFQNDFNFDALDKEEREDFDTYIGWKIKTTLGESVKGLVRVANRSYEYHDIFRDMQNDIYLWMFEKRDKLKGLSPEEVWKLLNNHTLNWLQYKYKRKVARESTMAVCGTVQNPRDYDETDLADIGEASLSKVTDKSKHKKKEVQHGEVKIIEFDENGNVIGAEAEDGEKETMEDEEVFMPETEEEEKFFGEEPEDDDQEEVFGEDADEFFDDDLEDN